MEHHGVNLRTWGEGSKAQSSKVGYRRTVPVRRPKLDGFTELIGQELGEDRTCPRKQRHSAKRVFDRLRSEYGLPSGARS